MKIFVSGATGFIGQRLALRLAEGGHQVHALYRNENKAEKLQHPNIAGFRGDLLDENSLKAAMKDCEQVFHVAAFAGVWTKDERLIYKLNVEATLKLLSCAAKVGIKRVVVTSTAGILGPSSGEEVNENSPAPSSFFTPYEASKARMEAEIGRLEAELPEVVIVNPTRVYGPGELSESNGVTRMIIRYTEGRWRFIPGSGDQSGNYVFVEDVVEGMILAMEKGRPGERYVLGGENISYRELFRIIRELSGKSYRLFHLPVWMMLTAAGSMMAFTMLTGRAPLITPGLVRKFNHHWLVSSQKAMDELGYQPLSAEEGIARVLEWASQS